jgi:heat shock protein HtpX
MAKPAGLKTHIWNNNLKSIMLLGFYPVLLMALTWLCAYAAGFYMQGGSTAQTGAAMYFAHGFLYAYWPAILAVVAIWFLVSYFFHTSMIRKLSHAHPVTRQDEPELYNLLENLCIAQGMTMPRLEIIETHARNAFASGIDDRSYGVTVTRGLLNSLTKDEVEAVLAHELTHIKNRDVRLLMVTVIFTGMIGFAAQMVWNSIRFNHIAPRGSRRQGGGGIFLILAIALILWLGYMATLLMRFAILRKREYMADAGAIEMTKNPEAMMSALMRIAGRAQIPETTDDIAMMCIENKKPFLGMFATHPPIEARVQAISQTTGTPLPQLAHAGPADKQARFASGSQRHNPWLVRQRGARGRDL